MQIVDHIAATHGSKATWKMGFADDTEREKAIAGWVEFRTHWRTAYKQLSSEIRKMKSTRKEHSSGYVPGLCESRREAHRMMLLRTEAKEQFLAKLKEL